MNISWLYKKKENRNSFLKLISLSLRKFFFNIFSIHFLKCVDETFEKISDEQIMKCNIKYYFYKPKGRFKKYLYRYKIPKQTYSITSNSILIGKELNGFDKKFKPIIESFPHKYLFTKNEKLKFKHIYLNNPKKNLDITVCPLFHKYNNYFHWFLDNLPRIFAVEHYEQSNLDKVYYLIPDDLPQWALDSLILMGIHKDKLKVIKKNKIYNCKKLISRRGHRCNKKISKYFDSISPNDLKNLSSRLKNSTHIIPKSDFPKRIILTREDTRTRKIINQNLIEEYLINYGFKSINLSKLSLEKQINLFHNASHIIAPHGAGLTNLIFCQKFTSVLEIHSINHGIRPDYLQISSIFNLDYYFECLKSIDTSNNIVVPIKTIKTFIEKTI